MKGRCTVILLALAVAAPSGSAQSCPGGTPLTLDTVLREIQDKVPDDHIAVVIGACHVAFALDPESIERLSAAGATTPIMDALDRDTLSRMRPEDARKEVAALENRMQANQAAVSAERDSALRKLDSDYAPQREKAAYVGPKGEFETTVEYNGKKQKIEQNVAAMDRNHETARNGITQLYAAAAIRKNQLLEHRISLLKNGLFSSSEAAPTYLSYDPDASRLVASVGGQEYWFSVEPSRAKALKEHWSTVKVWQRYEDDDGHSRFLKESTGGEPVPGTARAWVEAQARQKDIKTHLDRAAAAYVASNYELAKNEFESVLTLEPGNPVAIDGADRTNKALAGRAQAQAEVAGQQRKAAEFRRQLTENPKAIPGTWFDAATGLLWTDKDNGKDIDWETAGAYCASLTLGGFSDWRLGTIAELRGLYDPSKTRKRLSGKKALDWLNTTNGGTTAQMVGYEAYHIKGDINLSRTTSWSSTRERSAKGPQALMASFEVGGQQPFPLSTKEGRALCTHRVGNAVEVSRESAPVSISSGDAVLTILSAFPARPSVPLKDVAYGLLRVDLGTALTRAGFRVRAGEKPNDVILASCQKGSAMCQKAIHSVDPFLAATGAADARGKAVFPAVPAGTYYLMLTLGFNTRNYFWDEEIELKSGANSFTVTPRNATSVH